MDYHDIVNVFPQMSYEELQGLAEDIKANGQLEPILIYKGKIADGRNRFLACELAGIEPDFVDWLGSEENLINHVVSLNVKRRHLNQSQIAAISIEIKKMYEAVAKERQARGHFNAPQYKENPVVELSSLTGNEYGRARDVAGKEMGVSGRYIDLAETVKEKAPDLFDEVRRGNISLRQADSELKRRETVVQETPAGKFDIIYARPPLGILPDELIEMGRGIKAISKDDCLLVMCCPSSSLENIFVVTKSWGFKYRACFIWDKMKTQQGKYNQIKHEFILLCGKGDVAPEDPTMFYSIIPLEEDEAGADAHFMRMFQQLYPERSIIRLFQGGKVIGDLKA